MIISRPTSQASRIFGLSSGRLFGAHSSTPSNFDRLSPSTTQIPIKSESFSGCAVNSRGRFHQPNSMVPLSLGNMNMRRLGFIKMTHNVAPFSLSLRNSIHSGTPKEFETGTNSSRPINFRDPRDFVSGRNSKSMNFVRSILNENGMDNTGGSQFGQYGVEQNANVVHIKLMRNNTFVTVTDSKGNTKAGASIGGLKDMKGGSKSSRYAAEATTEHIGRVVRNMGLKSVVVKVNGFTHFKKKKQAILSFREGYTNSRGDQNPIVYIEDTTRRPHNGCRLRKQRRI